MGAGASVHIESKLSDSRIWDQTAGTLFVDTGDQITFTGTANTFSGCNVTGAGTFGNWMAGADVLTNFTLEATKMVDQSTRR